MESEFCDVFRNFTLRFALFVPRESLFYIFLKKKKKQDASFLKTTVFEYPVRNYCSVKIDSIYSQNAFMNSPHFSDIGSRNRRTFKWQSISVQLYFL